jgi:hypothetical protein
MIRGGLLVRGKFAERILSDGPAVTPAKAVPRYMLRQGSGAWVFSVNCLEGTIADEKGLHYVEYLLKNPAPDPIHAIQLQSAVCEVRPGSGGIFEITDPDTGKRITLSRTAQLQERNLNIDDREPNRRIWSIRRSLLSTIDDTTITEMEREEARVELADIDNVLNSMAFRDKSNAAKTYDRIRQALNRLLKNLDAKKTKDGRKDPAYAALSEHIRLHIVKANRRHSVNRTSRTLTGTAQTFIYDRPDGVVWSD